jgi:hypothetical protein
MQEESLETNEEEMPGENPSTSLSLEETLGQSDRRGVLFLDRRLLEQLEPEACIDQTTTMGQIRESGLFARLQKRLLLPASYRIVGLFSPSFGREWGLLIESADLPDAGLIGSLEYPRLEPRYALTLSEETGRYEPRLLEITVSFRRTLPITGGVDWLLKAHRANGTQR